MKSDRISVEVAIVVAGTDLMGTAFMVDGKTILVGRQGANITLSRKLAPQQEINIRCVETSKEAEARVVGQVGQADKDYSYSVEFLTPDANLWGIEFPPMAEGEEAVGRVVLECAACHTRELTYLNESQLEVLENNNSLARHCKRCADYTVWKKSTAEMGETEAAAPAAVPPPVYKRTENLRREHRREVRVTTCIRSNEYNDDIVRSRNASRGGVCFESTRVYAKGWKIEVAIPYTRGGANIFLSAQIVRVQAAPSGELSVYGVAYIQ
ncbi:MAG TPA: PilZ domain-containing protein [Terriglobia bacterium]|nr:PilZ domain-containing protein [Terriglobia bacterium]